MHPFRVSKYIERRLCFLVCGRLTERINIQIPLFSKEVAIEAHLQGNQTPNFLSNFHCPKLIDHDV
jgi:hypothetical protein